MKTITTITTMIWRYDLHGHRNETGMLSFNLLSANLVLWPTSCSNEMPKTLSRVLRVIQTHSCLWIWNISSNSTIASLSMLIICICARFLSWNVLLLAPMSFNRRWATNVDSLELRTFLLWLIHSQSSRNFSHASKYIRNTRKWRAQFVCSE